MKIAMISYHTCPLASVEGKETGGMNVYVLELAKALSKKGHFVDIFTRSQDSRNEEVVQVNSNLRVIHIPAGPQKPISKKEILPFIDEFKENVLKFSNQQNVSYEILHCHYYLSGLIGLKLKIKLKIPMTTTFHTLALRKNLVARSEEEMESKIRIDAEFLLCKESDIIISSSEAGGVYLEYFYDCDKEKIKSAPPGVDAETFHPISKKEAKDKIKITTNEKIILFVGRIEPLKGIDALIYAMKVLVKKHPTVPLKLIVVGGEKEKDSPSREELSKLEELTEVLKIPNKVNFVGKKSQEELPYYYNSAEVVVMPSHYESFGMAVLEAMACGIPVITSNVSGVANIIDDDSLITTVSNPLLLASQIEPLLINSQLHAKISKAVQHDACGYTWQNTALKTEEIYKSLIG